MQVSVSLDYIYTVPPLNQLHLVEIEVEYLQF